MTNRRNVTRLSLAALGLAAIAVISGCGMMSQPSNLVAMTTQLRGANEVPPIASQGSGSVDAMFNKDTNLLRWKVNYAGLSGAATAGHFHGPAAVGANAGVALGWPSPIANGMEGAKQFLEKAWKDCNKDFKAKDPYTDDHRLALDVIEREAAQIGFKKLSVLELREYHYLLVVEKPKAE